MRLSNDRDQALIRSAVSDAGASLLTFIPSLGTGEVFAFGAGVPLPTRMKFRELPAALRPTSEAGGNTRIAAGAVARPRHDRLGDRPLARRDHEPQGRSSTTRRRARLVARRHRHRRAAAPRYDRAAAAAAPAAAPQRPQPLARQPARPPDPPRPSILRRPIGAGTIRRRCRAARREQSGRRCRARYRCLASRRRKSRCRRARGSRPSRWRSA